MDVFFFNNTNSYTKIQIFFKKKLLLLFFIVFSVISDSISGLFSLWVWSFELFSLELRFLSFLFRFEMLDSFHQIQALKLSLLDSIIWIFLIGIEHLDFFKFNIKFDILELFWIIFTRTELFDFSHQLRAF